MPLTRVRRSLALSHERGNTICLAFVICPSSSPSLDRAPHPVSPLSFHASSILVSAAEPARETGQSRAARVPPTRRAELVDAVRTARRANRREAIARDVDARREDANSRRFIVRSSPSSTLRAVDSVSSRSVAAPFPSIEHERDERDVGHSRHVERQDEPTRWY